MATQALADLDLMYGKKTERPGGKYTAVQNPDGTWNILAIPFFASHTMRKGEGGQEIDEEWQGQAVALHQQRWTVDQYLSPLIVNHHATFGDVFHGGFFLPQSVGQAMENGAMKPCTFTDLLYLREDVYAAFRRGELPYLSSEFTFAPPDHVHLSALNKDAPWFKFPLITIGEETPYIEGQAGAYPETAPMAAVRAARSHVLALRTQLHKDTTMDPKAPGQPAAVNKRAEDDKKDDKPKGDSKPDEKGGDENKREGMAGIMSELKTLSAGINKAIDGMTKMVADALGIKADGGGTGGGDKPAEQPDQKGQRSDTAPAIVPDAELAKISPELAKRMADQQAELTILRASDQKRTARETRDLALRKAGDDLKALQIPNLQEELAKVYDDQAMGGEPGLNAYVAAMKRHAKPAPPNQWTGELDSGEGDDPAEVTAYSQAGPEKLALARNEARVFKEMNLRGFNRSGVTLARHLELVPGLGKAATK